MLIRLRNSGNRIFLHLCQFVEKQPMKLKATPPNQTQRPSTRQTLQRVCSQDGASSWLLARESILLPQGLGAAPATGQHDMGL